MNTFAHTYRITCKNCTNLYKFQSFIFRLAWWCGGSRWHLRAPVSVHVCVGFLCIFQFYPTFHKQSSRWIGWDTFPLIMNVCTHGVLQWTGVPSKVYFYLTPSVPGIDSGFTLSPTSNKWESAIFNNNLFEWRSPKESCLILLSTNSTRLYNKTWPF